MIRFTQDALTSIQQHALNCYPSECVALGFGIDTEIQEIVSLDNVANKLHSLDPIEYPRTSRDFFAFNEAKASKIIRQYSEKGFSWLALIHSHIDSCANISVEDIRYAAPFGKVLYPDVAQIIIEIHNDGIKEARSFRWKEYNFILENIHSEFKKLK